MVYSSDQSFAPHQNTQIPRSDAIGHGAGAVLRDLRGGLYPDAALLLGRLHGYSPFALHFALFPAGNDLDYSDQFHHRRK